MSLLCHHACGWCADEFVCESKEFFVCVFLHICENLCFGVCGVGCCGVFDRAGDADLPDCFEFVGVADDVTDEGVVWREKGVVVEWCACLNRFVFRAERYILDDLFDVFVIGDMCLSEGVEYLFECAVVVVFVVGDVVKPGCGDGVELEMIVLAAVLVVLIDDV